jgi:hypothetical protein
MERRAEIVAPMRILGEKDSSTEEEIAAYRQVHPQAHVIVLYQKDCGSGILE